MKKSFWYSEWKEPTEEEKRREKIRRLELQQIQLKKELREVTAELSRLKSMGK